MLAVIAPRRLTVFPQMRNAAVEAPSPRKRRLPDGGAGEDVEGVDASGIAEEEEGQGGEETVEEGFAGDEPDVVDGVEFFEDEAVY